MSRSETLYLNLPVWLQNTVCRLEGERIRSQRYGRRFAELLRDYHLRNLWSRRDIMNYRDQRLRRLLTECMNIPFYRGRFSDAGVDAACAHNLEDLKGVPILSKAEVQQAYGTSEWPARTRGADVMHTSGTTGAGLRFTATRDAVLEQWAVWWRYRSWHGISPGTLCAHFGGRSIVSVRQQCGPYWRYNRPGAQILFSSYHLTPNTVHEYVQELRLRRPLWLHGYPSVLSLLAVMVVENKLELGYQPNWITTGAENLLPHQADAITHAFGIRPRQHYGMAEAVANISECECGALHVDEDFAAVEFVPTKDPDIFKVVGTNITNPATPLLRYDTGDIVRMSKLPCGCGRSGRVVEAIDGRCEDYIVLKNGAHLGRMDHIFKDMINVREAQIHQSVSGKLLVRVVPGHSYTVADERRLVQELHQRVGRDTEFKIAYVDTLQRSSTGKLRFITSDLQERQFARKA